MMASLASLTCIICEISFVAQRRTATTFVAALRPCAVAKATMYYGTMWPCQVHLPRSFVAALTLTLRSAQFRKVFALRSAVFMFMSCSKSIDALKHKTVAMC